MSSKNCCVSGCLNSYPKAPKGTTWHPFPKNEDLAKKWMANIGKNVEKGRRNSVLCSQHFVKKDFKPSSHNTRNKRRILSSSAVPSILKNKNHKTNTNLQRHTRSTKSFLNVEQKLSSTLAEENVNTKVDISVLPLVVWQNIFTNFSHNDVIALASTCKHLQGIVQTIFNKFDFSYYHHLDINNLLNHTLSTTCTSINLNHCYWLKPKEILTIIHKTNLQHLYIIECKLNNKCIEAICDLNLTSLSFSYESHWRLFFNKQNTIGGFQDLKNLELFFKKFPSHIIFEMYAKVLIHCKELEHFKVFECISQSFSNRNRLEVEDIYEQISHLSTFVPKLKSLIINLKGGLDDRNVDRLIALIMKDKVIPLQYADFGHQIGYLFKKNILPDPKIILDKSTLSINCLNTDFNFWLNFPPIQSRISQPDYKTVKIQNVEPNGFYKFVRKISSNSGKTLQEIHIKHDGNFQINYFEFLNGLSHIAIHCPQITVIDITGHCFGATQGQEFPYISNEAARKHKALLNALVNLKNLEKLTITATILHCKYYKSNGEKLDKAMPFWKVTSACKSLTDIRISDCHLINHVHESSLYCISSCARLKNLHLARFNVYCTGDSKFDLSRITQSCDELTELYIRNVDRLSNHNYIFNKNIKIMSIYCFEVIRCNKAILNHLSQCENLEKFYLDSMYIGADDFQSLADVLRKLKNMTAFVVRRCVCSVFVKNDRERDLDMSKKARLDSLLKSIVNEKPAFFYSLKGFNRNKMPSSYLDSFYPNGIRDHYYIGR